MNSNSKFFKVFAECALVKGNTRSAIYDLPRGKYNLIPNELFDILSKYEGRSLDEIKANFDENDHATIDEYFEFLIKNEFIFYCDKDELELFPPLNSEWHYPGVISNAIIDLPKVPKVDYIEIVRQLEELGCQALILRFKDLLDERYYHLFKYVNDSDIRSAQIHTQYNRLLQESHYENLLKGHLKIRTCVIYGSPKESVINTGINGAQLICYIKNVMTDTIETLPAPNLFHVNIELFTESKYHNPYLNGKIYIDENGFIKNCFTHNQSFGNIHEHLIKDVITNEFKILWNVSKDKIAVCRDCEYRFMCVDNRTPVFDSDDYKHLTECNYDPYEGKWKN
ncbi:grasp-with-spasm system SPASM domain peptide maturase [Pedobacter sandarakinus]|uniref:grasp-with-spasm system SPASM domain peptide maturase n=1 Tax=Pedobacter sandarakinus TaxID=353156 RepID=UPI00224733AE|nr:grasp-with-spasm system SPASM domain peptide maturase [Pedobacter sandarakinus]MCX2575957.1 grasp-with-spasm system SPASM domain peptide maturase [Pedobacter sandarakinus]